MWINRSSFFKLITCQSIAVSGPVVIEQISCGIPDSGFALYVLPLRTVFKKRLLLHSQLYFFLLLCSAVVLFLVTTVADPSKKPFLLFSHYCSRLGAISKLWTTCFPSLCVLQLQSKRSRQSFSTCLGIFKTFKIILMHFIEKFGAGPI